MNLKKILMRLGNRLVTERGFAPTLEFHGTKHITEFTEWLNRTPDAIELLREEGMEWPVVQRKLFCIPTDQGTANSETCLCDWCFVPSNKDYVRQQAKKIMDIDPTEKFVDCSDNSFVNCCVCGSTNHG